MYNRDVLVEISTVYGFFTALSVLQELKIQAKTAILLISSNIKAPEADNQLYQSVKALVDYFNLDYEVVYLNDIIFPFHPSKLSGPKLTDLSKSVFYWAVAKHCNIKILLLESIQVDPSKFLIEIFDYADIYVYADGLMVYSPTRFHIPDKNLKRIKKVFYFDFLPNVKPLLLKEGSPEFLSIDKNIFLHFISEYKKRHEDVFPENQKIILITGQYLSDLGFFSQEDEAKLYIDIINQLYCSYGGSFKYVFKPHPSSSLSLVNIIKKNILCDINLCINYDYMPVELLYDCKKVELIAGIFSTALFSMNYLFNVKAVSFFSKDLYYALPNWFNSNRIPILISYLYLSSDNKNNNLSPETITKILTITGLSFDFDYFKDVYINNFLELLAICNFLKSNESCLNDSNMWVIDEPLNKLSNIDLLRRALGTKSLELDKKSNSVQKSVSNGTDNATLTPDVSLLRSAAEVCIDHNDFNQAKLYLKIAHILKPNNKNIYKRLMYVSLPRILRSILHFSKKS